MIMTYYYNRVFKKNYDDLSTIAVFILHSCYICGSTKRAVTTYTQHIIFTKNIRMYGHGTPGRILFPTPSHIAQFIYITLYVLHIICTVYTYIYILCACAW